MSVMLRNIKYISLCLIACFSFSSCFEETQKEEVYNDEDTYFSISQFFDDQWEIRKDDPVTLLRIFSLNGKTDSSFVFLSDTLWNQLRGFFDKADISHGKYIGM